jgi:tetratricopeptide (TPR) repeat protein
MILIGGEIPLFYKLGIITIYDDLIPDSHLLMKRFFIYFCLSLFLFIGTPLILSNYSVKAQTSLSQLVQNGRNAYDNEQYQQAVKYFQDAQQQFNHQENKLNQAIILSNLSLAYQKLGKWEEAEKTIQDSLQLLDIDLDRITTKNQENLQFFNLDRNKIESRIIASVLNVYGRFWYQRGHLEQALRLFQTASLIYQKLNQPSDYINSLFNQIQALQTLGYYTKARSTIEEILPILETLSPLQQIQGWRTVGEVFLKIGDPETSRQFLEKSLSLSEELDQTKEKQATLLSLGNTLWALGRQINNRQETMIDYNIIPWQCSLNSINPEALSFISLLI